MSRIGIVIVSHSKHIAQGVVDLIAEVAFEISITYVGGTETGEIGTSFECVQEAVETNQADVLLAFYDLGSAKMNLEIARDFSEKEIVINHVPIVEGAYTAAALLQAGVGLAEISKQLQGLEIGK